jgi:hypothetical protein
LARQAAAGARGRLAAGAGDHMGPRREVGVMDGAADLRRCAGWTDGPSRGMPGWR